MSNVIKTNRLEIKPYQDTDQDAMIDLLTNQEIKETFMIPDFQTEEEAIGMFKRLLALSYSDDHYDRGIYLNHQLIGFVNDVEISDGVIELGYVINPIHKNMGYATEMLRAVIDELFRKGFRQIVAGAFEDNAVSIQVMLKCGMKKIAKEDDICYRGVLHHCYYYAIFQDHTKTLD
jgi:RimJ/RimL family protein N-acetyltransferase